MKLRSIISCFLILSVMLTYSSCAEAKPNVRLSAKKLAITIGKSKTLKLCGTNKKIGFKISSGKKYIKIKRISKTSVKITALKKGDAKVKATLGKRSYTCAVTVKAKANVKTIKIKVNGKSFSVKLNNSKTATELYNKLPLTLKMTELNGNEKYHLFESIFSGKGKTYPTIKAGDLMIYDKNYLVLFYDDIKNSPYEYVKIGTLTNANGLKNTLGSGNVTIKATPHN